MKVLHLKTTDGREFYTDHVPKVSPKGIDISEMRIVDMTKDEYARIPATHESFKFFPHQSETPGAVEGFETCAVAREDH
jgi:hypothetical protein